MVEIQTLRHPVPLEEGGALSQEGSVGSYLSVLDSPLRDFANPPRSILAKGAINVEGTRRRTLAAFISDRMMPSMLLLHPNSAPRPQLKQWLGLAAGSVSGPQACTNDAAIPHRVMGT